MPSRALELLARRLLRQHLGGRELRSWRLAARWRLESPPGCQVLPVSAE